MNQDALPIPAAAGLTQGTREPLLAFRVLGEAKTAGSKKAFKHPHTDRIIVTDDAGKKGKQWRQDVKFAGRSAIMDRALLTGPLRLEVDFYRVRPAGHFGTGRNAGVLKASAEPYPAKRPDVLKLARAVEDALTGIIWRDDAQIVEESLRKLYGEPAHIMVRVWAL